MGVGGWEWRTKRELEEGEAWGSPSFVIFSSFLPITLKKKKREGAGGERKDPGKFVMNDDITSGSPTVPASRPVRLENKGLFTISF